MLISVVLLNAELIHPEINEFVSGHVMIHQIIYGANEMLPLLTLYEYI